MSLSSFCTAAFRQGSLPTTVISSFLIPKKPGPQGSHERRPTSKTLTLSSRSAPHIRTIPAHALVARLRNDGLRLNAITPSNPPLPHAARKTLSASTSGKQLAPSDKTDSASSDFDQRRADSRSDSKRRPELLIPLVQHGTKAARGSTVGRLTSYPRADRCLVDR